MRFVRGIKKNLVLRPTKGPLLNAPKNSTQFIIDDHEPFLDTEVSPKKYNTRSRSVSSSSRRVSASEEAFCSPSGSPEKTVTSSTTAAASNEKASANAGSAAEKSSKEEKDCQATPGNYVVGDDDVTIATLTTADKHYLVGGDAITVSIGNNSYEREIAVLQYYNKSYFTSQYTVCPTK